MGCNYIISFLSFIFILSLLSVLLHYLAHFSPFICSIHILLVPCSPYTDCLPVQYVFCILLYFVHLHPWYHIFLGIYDLVWPKTLVLSLFIFKTYHYFIMFLILVYWVTLNITSSDSDVCWELQQNKPTNNKITKLYSVNN